MLGWIKTEIIHGGAGQEFGDGSPAATSVTGTAHNQHSVNRKTDEESISSLFIAVILVIQLYVATQSIRPGPRGQG